MITIKLKDNEVLEKGIKRFRKKIEQIGLLKLKKKTMFYEKPSVQRKQANKLAAYKQVLAMRRDEE